MKLILAALMGAMLWLSVTVQAMATPPFVMSEAPKPVPELNFTDGESHARTLADFKGKVILLNIWATWCVPCRKEMPTLDRLQAALGGTDFEVVPLSIDRKGMEVVNKFYDEIGIQHLSRFVDSGNEAFQKLAIVGVPTTLLIDRQGRELGRLIGPSEWDSPDMIAFLKDTITKQKETVQ